MSPLIAYEVWPSEFGPWFKSRPSWWYFLVASQHKKPTSGTAYATSIHQETSTSNQTGGRRKTPQEMDLRPLSASYHVPRLVV